MKRIITLTLLVGLVTVFSMSISAKYTYPPSYYKGTLAVDLTSIGMAKTNLDDQYVSITPTTPGYCTLALYNFNFDGLNLGDIIIEEAQLTEGHDGGFDISGSKKGITLADESITADVTCQGFLDVNGNLDLTIQVTYSGLTIPVTFSGSYTDLDEGIADVEADASADIEYYTLGGMPVAADTLTHGYYIKCQGNKAVKVLMR